MIERKEQGKAANILKLKPEVLKLCSVLTLSMLFMQYKVHLHYCMHYCIHFILLVIVLYTTVVVELYDAEDLSTERWEI